jgi:hypothetical protein
LYENVEEIKARRTVVLAWRRGGARKAGEVELLSRLRSVCSQRRGGRKERGSWWRREEGNEARVCGQQIKEGEGAGEGGAMVR